MTSRPLALITGASRGIGAAVAAALADTHDLLLGGRDETRLAELAAGFPNARPWPVELTDPAAVAAGVEGITDLNVLVHSAGISRLGSVADLPTSAWRESYEINVLAVVDLTRRLLPALRAGAGHVVLINSGSGPEGQPGLGRLRDQQVRPARVRRRPARGGAGPAGHLDPPRPHRHRHAA